MFGIKLCSPALIYLVFSLTQVVIDSIKGLYNVALLKFIMMFLFTLLLNILCETGLGVVSWIIVFVPFILMSVITSILLFVFGLDPTSGKIFPRESTLAGQVSKKTDSLSDEISGIRKDMSIHSIKNKLHHATSLGEKEISGLRKEMTVKSAKNKLHHAAAAAKQDTHELLVDAKQKLKEIDSYL